MKFKRSVLLFYAILTFAGSSAAQLPPTPTPTPGLPVKREPVLRTGMSLRDAMKVAINSMREASGYKTIGSKKISKKIHQVKLYRPEDTLANLGISSADRLNALRRYLIRNEEVGVQSILDLETPISAIFHPRRYMLPRAKLKDLSSNWTLLKLAQTIQDGAGLPRLPRATAAQIIADCTKYPNDGQGPIPKPETDAERINLYARIPVDGFYPVAKCIVDSEDYGISTVTLFTPDDEKVNYFLRSNPKDILTKVKTENWTYQNLIRFVADNAQVRMPVDSVARGIVIAHILRQVGSEAKFRHTSALGEIKDDAGKHLDLQRLGCEIAQDIGSRTLILTHCEEDAQRYPLALANVKSGVPYSDRVRKIASTRKEGDALPLSPRDTVKSLFDAVQIEISQQ